MIHPLAFIIGPINIKVKTFVDGKEIEINRVEFFIDDKFLGFDENLPYNFLLDEKIFGRHQIKVIAFDKSGGSVFDKIDIFVINI